MKPRRFIVIACAGLFLFFIRDYLLTGSRNIYMGLSPNVPRSVGWLSKIDTIESSSGVAYSCSITYTVNGRQYILNELVNNSAFHTNDSVHVRYMPANPQVATIRVWTDTLKDIVVIVFIFILVIVAIVKNWNHK